MSVLLHKKWKQYGHRYNLMDIFFCMVWNNKDVSHHLKAVGESYKHRKDFNDEEKNTNLFVGSVTADGLPVAGTGS